jgi:hypothetical protein
MWRWDMPDLLRKPGSAAVFVVMRRLLGMVMRDLYLA